MEQDVLDEVLENDTPESTEEQVDLTDIPEYEQAILTAAHTYFTYTGETVDDTFLLLLIQRVVEDYQRQRHYPDGLSENAITEDVEAYFAVRTGYIATEVIPAMLGKVGGEGLYSLVDNQVSKNWKYPFPVYLPDVVPYCEVV